MCVKKILVVDDETLIRELYALFFSRTGYAVKTAASAEDALKILETEKFEVFLLDLNLPGMSGVDLCRAIRHANPLTIAIAVTGYISRYDLKVCIEAGFEDYFHKPVNLELLAKAVGHAFDKLERWNPKS